MAYQIYITNTQTSIVKSNSIDREKEDGKRSLSIGSTGYPDANAELDTREKEKDKKGRKNSVFGNLFKKKQKKLSKDEDISRELEATEKKGSTSTAAATATAATQAEAEANESEDLLRNDWATASAPGHGVTTQISRGNQGRAIEDQERTKYTSPDANLSPKEVMHSYSKVHCLLFRNYDLKLRHILLWIPIPMRLRRLRVKAAKSKRRRFHGQMPRYIPSWTTIPAFGMYWF